MKINRFKQNVPYLLLIFILMQPFIDIFTAIGDINNWSISFGVITRGAFFLATSFYLLTKKQWCLQVLVIFGFMFTSILIKLTEPTFSVADISMLFKIFYLPIVAIFFYQFKNKLFSKSIYFWLFILYCAFLIIPAIFQFGIINPINYDGKIWQRGLFSAGNDISAIIICLSPIILLNFATAKKWHLFIITLTLLTISAFLIGTKTTVISLFVIAIFITYRLCRKLDRKIKLGLFAGLATLIFGAIAILPFTPVWKNTIIALEYHGVYSVYDLARPEIIDKVILSERPTFFAKSAQLFSDTDLNQKLFGIMQLKNPKAVESDPFDIFFNIGIIGSVVYIFLIVYFVRKVEWHKIAIPQKFSCIILLIIALFVGHVLLTPAVATILALNFIRQNKSI